MTWTIRPATIADAEALIAFNCAIARETESRELVREVVARGVIRGLEQTGDVSYYVADAGGQVIGSLMLTREWSDWRDGWLMWVQSVYVASTWRSQGVFRSLLDHVLERLQQNPDVVGVRLYVELENSRAQAVYARSGFVDPHYKVLERLF